MKSVIVGALALILSSAARCEETATALIARLPVPPANLCEPSPDAEAAFRLQLTTVSREIKAALAKLNKQQKAYVKEHEAEWREQMMKQSGLTEEQIAQVKAAKGNRKASAAVKRQIAEQALEQYANLSIDEVRKLKKMSPEAKKAWTEAYANQEIATAQAKAQSQTDEEKAKDAQERERLGQLAKLADEQKKLMDQIGAPRDVIWQKMRELDDHAEKTREQMIGPLDLQLADCSKEVKLIDEDFRRQAQQYKKEDGQSLSHEEAEAYGNLMKQHEQRLAPLYVTRDRLEKQKTEALKSICTQFSPVYGGLIREYLEWAKAVQPDFERYEKMENEKFALQMKTPGMQLTAAIGTLGLQEAHACVDLLQSADKYAKQYRNRRTEQSDAAQSGAEP